MATSQDLIVALAISFVLGALAGVFLAKVPFDVPRITYTPLKDPLLEYALTLLDKVPENERAELVKYLIEQRKIVTTNALPVASGGYNYPFGSMSGPYWHYQGPFQDLSNLDKPE